MHLATFFKLISYLVKAGAILNSCSFGITHTETHDFQLRKLLIAAQDTDL